jgi:hypothetical protein
LALLTEHLVGHRFQTGIKVEEAVPFTKQKLYAEGIHSLVTQEKCLNLQDDYVEK